MKLYKLLYKPLGLYFTPNKGNGNLSKIGKIYRIKPNPKTYNYVSIRASSWLGKQTNIQKIIQFDSLFSFKKLRYILYNFY